MTCAIDEMIPASDGSSAEEHLETLQQAIRERHFL
jgi:hypothetical protein